MDFFGVGPLEILLVVLLALVLFGPKDIASNARSAGRFLNQLYKSEGWKTMTTASSALRNLPNRLAREAELEQLEQVRRDLTDPSTAPMAGPAPSTAPRAGPAPSTAPPPGMSAWTAPPAEPPPPTDPPPAADPD
jgi:sec-independent protein translocase protein TatB